MPVHIFENPAVMSAAAAEWITSFIEQRLGVRSKFTLLMSGGSTPKQLYSLLATDPFRNRIDWVKLHIFFGDERFVPFEDENNNGGMAYNQLIRLVDIPPVQVHYIRTNIPKEESATQYEQLLREYFPGGSSTFDLSLLGMGSDGHTLSLFPGSPALYEKNKWVIPARATVPPVERITLTAPAVRLSASIVFLITGTSKSIALQQVLNGDFHPELYPSQLFRENNTHWFADRDATQKLINADN